MGAKRNDEDKASRGKCVIKGKEAGRRRKLSEMRGKKCVDYLGPVNG